MNHEEASTTEQDQEIQNGAPVLSPEDTKPAPEGQGGMEPPREPQVATSQPPVDSEEGEGKHLSPQKLAANRANSRHSTGPTSPEGKEKTRLNAVKHGLTARYFPQLVQAGTAESQEWEELRSRLMEHYQPVGPVEALLVEKIAVELLRYNRLLAREQDPRVLGSGLSSLYVQVVDKMTRYQSTINRQLFQTIGELERQQGNRKAKEQKSEEAEQSGDR
jgi:hypothetical protein